MSTEPRTTDNERTALEGRVGIMLGLWPGRIDVGGDRAGFVAYLTDFIEREGRRGAERASGGLDVEALRQALVTVYHWALPEDEEDDAEGVLRVEQIAAEYARLTGGQNDE